MNPNDPVHSIDLLEEALSAAEKIGIEVRPEWLGESTGGVCRIGTKHILFLDLSLSAAEQLKQAIEALRSKGLPDDVACELSLPLRSRVNSAD